MLFHGSRMRLCKRRIMRTWTKMKRMRRMMHMERKRSKMKTMKMIMMTMMTRRRKAKRTEISSTTVSRAKGVYHKSNSSRSLIKSLSLDFSTFCLKFGSNLEGGLLMLITKSVRFFAGEEERRVQKFVKLVWIL